MDCHSIGLNAYVPAGQVRSNVPGAVQCEWRSGWSVHQQLADGNNTGGAEVVKKVKGTISVH